MMKQKYSGLDRPIKITLTYDCHGAEGALPNNFPRMATLSEANLSSGSICALSNRISMQCETVGLDVNVPGTVLRVPGMKEGSQLGLVGGKA